MPKDPRQVEDLTEVEVVFTEVTLLYALSALQEIEICKRTKKY